jgi:uroporphyrinogen-III decarboxylase
VVSPDIFVEYALPPLKTMISRIKAFNGLAALHICGDTHPIIEHMDTSGADLLSIEDISVKTNTIKMGGIATSTVLYGSPMNIETEARTALTNDFLILSTSCDVPIQTPPENIEAMIAIISDKTSSK